MLNKKNKTYVIGSFNDWKWYLIAVLLTFSLLLGVRAYVNHFTTGDEPHYLLVDYSLQHDHDLDLKNNYANKDYWVYSPEYNPPHVSYLNLQKPFAGWYSFHGIGLSFLLFPAFLLAGKIGAVVAMILIAVVVVILSGVWTYVVTRNKKGSYIVCIALTACYFFNGLAGYIYPDLAVAALSLAAFIVITTDLYKKKPYQLLLGLLLGAMVFLHFRTLALVAPIGLVFLYLHWEKYGRKIPWLFLAPSVFLALLFFLTLHRWFGVWEPNAIYSSNVGVSVKNLINDTPAMLFDSLRGAFVYNPILFIIPVGLPLWYKYDKRTFKFLYMLLPLIFVVFGFNEWHGGYSPNGRYLMGLLPILMPAIAMFYLYARQLVNRIMFNFLLGSTIVISFIANLIKQPYTGYALRSPVFIQIEKYTSIGFDKMFPRYNFIDNSLTDRYGLIQACFWMVVLLGLVAYGFLLTKMEDNGVTK